jgi:curved DNA-binding protein CbpA
MRKNRSAQKTKMARPTHYDILSLPPPNSPNSPTLDTQALKKAYRKALLTNHPDKSSSTSSSSTPSSSSCTTKPSSSSSTTTQKYTIDQVSLAFATLSSPVLKQAYDKSLLLTITNPTTTSSQNQPKFQTGIETTDLDDLDYDPSQNQWYRSCRCGNPRGYLVGEQDLEDASDLGELMVGCADCSLWLRVHFAVVEEEEEDDEGQDNSPSPGVEAGVEAKVGKGTGAVEAQGERR